jgi:AcrR family transcriptional regulator
MLTVSTSAGYHTVMAKKHGYHHGDLRRALLQEAVRIIQKKGVDGLTLRVVGARLGVSRTALYRHFADKSALLEAVATEGFRMLRVELIEAWNGNGHNGSAFEAMGMAYVRFAVANPSHYRVMFGGHVEADADSERAREGAGAFQALVDALLAQQTQGSVLAENTLRLAQYVWATVHGIAMHAIDGLIERQQTDLETFVRFANERIRAAISV